MLCVSKFLLVDRHHRLSQCPSLGGPGRRRQRIGHHRQCLCPCVASLSRCQLIVAMRMVQAANREFKSIEGNPHFHIRQLVPPPRSYLSSCRVVVVVFCTSVSEYIRHTLTTRGEAGATASSVNNSLSSQRGRVGLGRARAEDTRNSQWPMRRRRK